MANRFALSKNDHRLRSYDLLRGLAILGVITVHTSQNFPTNLESIDFLFGLGSFGVQLFYLISALTMCHMWQQRKGEQEPIRKFYIRRFLRIAPLFWLAIPIYLFANGTGVSYWAPEGIGARQVLLTATFLHGFWPDSINSVVPGGWSIAVEMTFYIVFPFLMLVFHEKKTFYLLAGLLLWTFNVFIFQDFLINFFLEHYQTNSKTIIEEYLNLNFINQAPVFLLGCYIYYSLHSKISRWDIVIFAVWLMIAVFAKYFFDNGGIGFFVAFSTLGLFVNFIIRKNVKLKPLEALGKNSYSIYITHFLILSILINILPQMKGPIAFFVCISITVLVSYALSVLLYVVIERKVHIFASHITKSGNPPPVL